MIVVFRRSGAVCSSLTNQLVSAFLRLIMLWRWLFKFDLSKSDVQLTHFKSINSPKDSSVASYCLKLPTEKLKLEDETELRAREIIWPCDTPIPIRYAPSLERLMIWQSLEKVEHWRGAMRESITTPTLATSVSCEGNLGLFWVTLPSLIGWQRRSWHLPIAFMNILKASW